MFSNTSFFAYYRNHSLIAIIFYKSLEDDAQADSMPRVAYTAHALVLCKTNLLQEKNKNVIYRARSVRMGKNCARGLEYGPRPRGVLKTSGTVFSHTNRPSPVNNIYVLGVFWPRRGRGPQANHGTVRKGAIFPQPGNQKRLKWSNTAYVNKKSFTFQIKFVHVFQVTKTYFFMKAIRIFNAQPVKITHFKSLLTRERARRPHFLLHFFNVHIIKVNYAIFQ